MANLPGVHHHVALRRRGGAAGVARTLARLQGSERPVSLSYELDEAGNGDSLEAFACQPGDLALAAPEATVVHVHATRDWGHLLAGFEAHSRPLVITAHDSSLLTGGCVFPVFCPGHAKGCQDPCPRNFPASFENRSRKLKLVAAVRPALVSPSAWLASQLRREWPDIAVRVVPNGVFVPDTPPDKAAARAKLGIAPEARAALFLAHGGAKAAYKGGERFEAILARLAAMVPGLLGLVVGGEETRRTPAVLHYPYLEGEALAGVLAASDVLVYPSMADNHPLVILEAMARGLPVAAYAAGGIGEQVADGVTGFLVPVLDEDGLLGAAARILTDHSLARSMGASSRERAKRHFTADRMASGYAKVYEKAAGA